MIKSVLAWLRGGAPSPDIAPAKGYVASVMVSPWQVFRAYAAPPDLLLRNEHGAVMLIGSVAASDAGFSARLDAQPKQAWQADDLDEVLKEVGERLTALSDSAELIDFGRRRSAEPVAHIHGPHIDLSLWMPPA